jgi:hypothetical protein
LEEVYGIGKYIHIDLTDILSENMEGPTIAKNDKFFFVEIGFVLVTLISQNTDISDQLMNMSH